MVEVEYYHVMSESGILQKINKEDPDNQSSPGTRNLREQAMMAWETLDEPLEKQDEVESTGNFEIQFETDEFMKKNKKFNMSITLHLMMMASIFSTLNHLPL